jgi:hypothetical protein
LCVGFDSGDNVTEQYENPGTFTGGTILRVAIDVSDEAYLDLECEAAGASYATKRHSCRRSHDGRSDEATVGVRIAARLSTVVVAIGCPCRADGLGPGGGLL